jgi:hypothetical protein
MIAAGQRDRLPMPRHAPGRVTGQIVDKALHGGNNPLRVSFGKRTNPENDL